MGEGGQTRAELRVVVVDDDALVLAVTRRVLTRAGYTVAVFDNPATALAEIARSCPFAVVADLHMPDMDGTQLLARVAEASPASWRLLYTGEGQSSELDAALAPGLTHAIVPKAAGAQLLPDALASLRRSPA